MPLSKWEQTIKDNSPYRGLKKNDALKIARIPQLRGMTLPQLEEVLRHVVSKLFDAENPPSIADREHLLQSQHDILRLQSLHLGQDPDEMPGDTGLTAAIGDRSGMNLYESQVDDKPFDFEKLRTALTNRDRVHANSIKKKTGTAKKAAIDAYERSTRDDRFALAAHDKSKEYFKDIVEKKSRKLELLGNRKPTDAERSELNEINLKEARGA